MPPEPPEMGTKIMSEEIPQIVTPVLPEDIHVPDDVEEPLKAADGLKADLAKTRAEKRELKKRTEELEQRLTEMERAGLSEVEKLKAQNGDLVKLLEEMKTETQKAQRETLRRSIASEFGLSDAAARRLQGDDEDSMRKDAEELASLLGATATPQRSPAKTSAQIRNTAVKKDPGQALKDELKDLLKGRR